MKRSFDFLILAGCLLFVIMMAAFAIELSPLQVDSVRRRDFVVDEPFGRMVLKMAARDVLEVVVQKNHGTVVARTWDEFEIGSLGIAAKGDFVVEMEQPRLGTINMHMRQEVWSERNRLVIHVYSVEGSKGINLIDSWIVFVPSDRGTEVSLTNRISVCYTLPKTYRSVVTAEVTAANEEHISRVEESIREVISHTLLETVFERRLQPR